MMNDKDTRAKRVAWALAMTQGTVLMPSRYEQELLDQYVREQLSLDEVIDLLELHETQRVPPAYAHAKG